MWVWSNEAVPSGKWSTRDIPSRVHWVRQQCCIEDLWEMEAMNLPFSSLQGIVCFDSCARAAFNTRYLKLHSRGAAGRDSQVCKHTSKQTAQWETHIHCSKCDRGAAGRRDSAWRWDGLWRVYELSTRSWYDVQCRAEEHRGWQRNTSVPKQDI